MQIMSMDITPNFFCHFSKDYNFSYFSFASLGNETLSKISLLLKERICSWRSKFFPLRVDSNRKKEAKLNLSELLPLKVQPFTLIHQ